MRSEPQPPRLPRTCPLCAGPMVEVALKGEVSGGSGGRSYLVAKYQRPGKFFASKSSIESVACSDCGHVLLYLSDRSIIAPSG